MNFVVKNTKGKIKAGKKGVRTCQKQKKNSGLIEEEKQLKNVQDAV